MAKLICDGWWEQEGFGRQPMNNLEVDVNHSDLSGSGDDIIGPFALRGKVAGDRIAIRKQYHGQHSIDYHGTTDGEGMFFGHWSAGPVIGGKWLIRIRSATEKRSRRYRAD